MLGRQGVNYADIAIYFKLLIFIVKGITKLSDVYPRWPPKLCKCATILLIVPFTSVNCVTILLIVPFTSVNCVTILLIVPSMVLESCNDSLFSGL